MGSWADWHGEARAPEWLDGEMTLNDLQSRILLYVVERHRITGRAPTYDEMERRFHKSRSTIKLRVDELVRWGFLTRKPHSVGTLRPDVRVVRFGRRRV